MKNVPNFTLRTGLAIVAVFIIGAFIPGFFDEIIGVALAYFLVK